MAKTPNYGLTTYALNDDFRFVDYRMAEAGTGAESPSNMEIIDTQLKAVNDKVDEVSDNISNNYLPLVGGTMTGPIQMNTPSGYKVFIHPKASNTDNGWGILSQASNGELGNSILTLNGSNGKWCLGGYNLDGWINVQPDNCGMQWTTNDGTTFFVKSYKPNNMFQITRKVGDSAESSVLTIYKDKASFNGNASTATTANNATSATRSSLDRFVIGSKNGYIEVGSSVRIMYLASENKSEGFRLMYGVIGGSWKLAPEYLGETGGTDCGDTSAKWYNGVFKNIVYCASVSQTSDRRLKENIQDVDSKYLDLFDNLNPVTYKFIDKEKGSIGFISQDVEEAIKKSGFREEELDIVTKSRKTELVNIITEVPDIDDEDGDILGTKTVIEVDSAPTQPEDYEYGLNYSSFISLNTAAIKRAEKKIQEQQAEIDELRSALQSLTDKVKQLGKG